MSSVKNEPLVVRGKPDDLSLAALVLVLTLLGGRAAAGPPPARTRWAGESGRPAPGAWRSSALPR
ncbi:acyl-CoA carboxylase epsilon subunit [Amycolatopsis sp. NPDC026612]|uniref:acyl-CoA carboxylase epsilon subunit n=1 Tax=Amycolatopsis sp. NPDC026612 TaxID=3155466 RepID=UPI003408BE8F